MTDDPNPYQPPPTANTNADSGASRSRIFGSGAFAVGVAQALLWIVLGVLAMRIVLSFQRVFADFDAELPMMTIAVISFARFLSRFWFVVVPPILCWPFINWGIVSLLSSCPAGRTLRWLWYLATWLVPLAAVPFAVVALLGPLVTLIDRLSR